MVLEENFQILSMLFSTSMITDMIFIGVPIDVVKRAAVVLDAIGNSQHVERLSNENIEAQDQQYKVSFLIYCA